MQDYLWNPLSRLGERGKRVQSRKQRNLPITGTNLPVAGTNLPVIVIKLKFKAIPINRKIKFRIYPGIKNSLRQNEDKAIRILKFASNFSTKVISLFSCSM